MDDLEIIEHDEAGNVVATYVHSRSRTSREKRTSQSRVDVIYPANSKTIWHKVLDVFLPAGYPHSVTEDYLKYQIYDSLQAFSSSIAGLLSSRAVLEGVGVGDATASPTAALVLSIFQESIGRIATILFAWRLGTSLEPECKMYRLLADILNDLAMILDCLSPAFPKSSRVIVLSFASALRALCGVAAGSAKASLSAHFARWGNLGELNAKDSSQETVISLLGMLTGSLIVSHINTTIATWTALISLLAIHLLLNYAAVTSVTLRSLNRQRATILFSVLAGKGEVLTPQQVAGAEYIFGNGRVMTLPSGSSPAHCRIGVSMHAMNCSIGQLQRSGSVQFDTSDLQQVLTLFKNEKYILWYEERTNNALIVLKRGATALDQLRGWAHSLLTAKRWASLMENSNDAIPGMSAYSTIKTTLAEVQELFARHEQAIQDAGWDLSFTCLETKPGMRISEPNSDTE